MSWWWKDQQGKKDVEYYQEQHGCIIYHHIQYIVCVNKLVIYKKPDEIMIYENNKKH